LGGKSFCFLNWGGGGGGKILLFKKKKIVDKKGRCVVSGTKNSAVLGREFFFF